MSKPNLTRLRILAAWLKTVPPKRFDLSVWSSGRSAPGDKRANCGTVGCAVGWGAACPQLRRMGLGLDGGYPRYGHLSFWEAVEAFFGLSADEAESLFHEDCYTAGRGTRLPTVIKRIESFIRKHEKAES